MTIVEFLEARLTEDEAIARATYFDDVNGFGYAWPNAKGEVRSNELVHSRRHDPARVLREVAAKRAIMAEHGIDQDPCDAHDAMYESAPCDVILNLAAIYLDHPDDQAEWAIP
ncbi:DUF6221 family protein [Streptomyces albus]